MPFDKTSRVGKGFEEPTRPQQRKRMHRKSNWKNENGRWFFFWPNQILHSNKLEEEGGHNVIVIRPCGYWN